jgi:glycine betaine/proline transport system ATP-binding protein
MEPVTGETGGEIPADMLIRDGMDRLIGADRPLAVVEAGRVIGQLGKDNMLKGLCAAPDDAAPGPAP